MAGRRLSPVQKMGFSTVLPVDLVLELDKFCEDTEALKTDIIETALRNWLAARPKKAGKK